MRSAVISTSVLLGLFTNVLCKSSNGDTKSTSIQDFPYFASIEVNGLYACAATIVDDKYVITASSCVQGVDVNSIAVRVGTSKQGQRGDFFNVVNVTSWKSIPYIGPSPKAIYDIAMVKVAASFSYSPNVMWANPNADGIQELLEGFLVGWAAKNEWGGPLASGTAVVLPSRNCSQIYLGMLNISDDMYCLRPTDPNTNLCFADMGAPFYLNEQLYGVVTHNPGCEQPQLPLVITGVVRLTSFIVMVLCDLESIFGDTLTTYGNIESDSLLSGLTIPF